MIMNVSFTRSEDGGEEESEEPCRGMDEYLSVRQVKFT